MKMRKTCIWRSKTLQFDFSEMFYSCIEMKSLSAFKNYACGEPTCRLYVKNIAKQAEVKVLLQLRSNELHWAFSL